MHTAYTIFPAALVLGVVSASAMAGLPAHPRLLLSHEGVARLKQRIQANDWAKESWQAVKERADALLKEQVDLPPRGSNWSHWYACPEHGVRLTTGKKIGPWQWEHICTVDNAVLKSDPSRPDRDYDGCAIHGVHSQYSQAIRDLGLVYQVTGDRRYASKAREILLAYADVYLKYPLHTINAEAKLGGGRVGAQTLDEAVWLIPVCQGADMIWDTLSEDDRRAIADKLLLPAAKDVILPHKMGVNNIQCWKNSAVGLVGFLLGDQDLIHEAIEDPNRGYRTQMAKGVLPDGDWLEGAWGYHFYTMSALWPLAEAARNCGIDLYGPELRGMFDAPLIFSMPNLHLPAFNDSTERDVMETRALYELGYARYHNPDYLRVLSRGDRKNDHALWFGEPDLPKAPAKSLKSINYPRSGYAILTGGKAADASWLCMKYGPHGGGHGHPDKLNFVLYARGQVIGVDPGTCLYGLPAHDGWYKTSIAHNTLVVDETSQQPAEGKCIGFGSEKHVDYVVAEAGGIYEGVRFVRSVARLAPELIVVVDQVMSDKERLLDIAYHQRGTWIDLPSGDHWTAPDKPGYKYFKDATVRPLTGSRVLTTGVSDDWRVAVTVESLEPADLITADGIGVSTEDRVPAAIVRRKGTASAVLWAIALDGKPARVERLPVNAGPGDGLQPVALCVTAANGQTWKLVANPDKRRCEVTMPGGAKCSVDTCFAVR
jgi:hypothetical protein